MSGLKEKGKYNASWSIDKFKDPDNKIAKMLKNGAKVEALKNLPFYKCHEKIEGNSLLNLGINELWDIFIGDSANVFNNAQSLVGVGNDNTAVDPANTDLLGGLTDYQEMDLTYPLRGSQSLTFRATFESADANFSWQEFVIKHLTSGICINRKTFDKGTKSVGETWLVTLVVTLS